MQDDSVLVASFNWNEQEEVRASMSVFGGRLYADIRVFWLDMTDGKYKPSKKGIHMPADYLEHLKSAVDAMYGLAMQRKEKLQT